jgi:hypothetical protein
VLSVWVLRYALGGLLFHGELCRALVRVGLTPLFGN